MKTLLEYREKMKLFLGKYDIYIFPVLKFALALIVFLSINGNVGFMSRLTNPGIALVLALMCSFLPLNVTAVFGALLILGTLAIFVVLFWEALRNPALLQESGS